MPIKNKLWDPKGTGFTPTGRIIRFVPGPEVQWDIPWPKQVFPKHHTFQKNEYMIKCPEKDCPICAAIKAKRTLNRLHWKEKRQKRIAYNMRMLQWHREIYQYDCEVGILDEWDHWINLTFGG